MNKFVPVKMDHFKRKWISFQASFFRGYMDMASFRIRIYWHDGMETLMMLEMLILPFISTSQRGCHENPAPWVLKKNQTYKHLRTDKIMRILLRVYDSWCSQDSSFKTQWNFPGTCIITQPLLPLCFDLGGVKSLRMDELKSIIVNHHQSSSSSSSSSSPFWTNGFPMIYNEPNSQHQEWNLLLCAPPAASMCGCIVGIRQIVIQTAAGVQSWFFRPKKRALNGQCGNTGGNRAPWAAKKQQKRICLTLLSHPNKRIQKDELCWSGDIISFSSESTCLTFWQPQDVKIAQNQNTWHARKGLALAHIIAPCKI